MPLLNLNVAGVSLSHEQRAQLQSGLTTLMVDVLHKVGSLTVVHVRGQASGDWSVGGRSLTTGEWTASLEVFITEGTNTEDDQSAFISAAMSLIQQTIGRAPATPLYIIVHNIKATQWGYDGKTQQSRRKS